MYCVCGAIHDFCIKCNKPSIFISHCGHADDPVTPEVDEKSVTPFLPGTGIPPESVEFTIYEYGDLMVSYTNTNVRRCDPKKMSQKIEDDTDDVEDDEKESYDGSGKKFFIGDLQRRYAIVREQIGDRLVEFSLTGPDGGVPTRWYCDSCDRNYGVTDK